MSGSEAAGDLVFTTCTNPIIHLFYPQKSACIAFDFSCFLPREIANNGYAKVLGGNRGVLWDCVTLNPNPHCFYHVKCVVVILISLH